MNTHFTMKVGRGRNVPAEIKIGFVYPAVKDRHLLPTLCTIEFFNTTTGKLVLTLTGESYCSESDQFRKKTGRLIALQRAAGNIKSRSLRHEFLKRAK